MTTLATTYGVRRSTISELLLTREGVPRWEQRTISLDESQQAVRLYAQGWSLARIGAELGFDGETIRTHLNRGGVVIRSTHGLQDKH